MNYIKMSILNDEICVAADFKLISLCSTEYQSLLCIVDDTYRCVAEMLLFSQHEK